MLTSLGRPPRRCCLAGGIMGSTIVHCSSVRSEGYAFRELPSCTIYAHSSPERICANYLPNLFLCQVIFPDSLLEQQNASKDDKEEQENKLRFYTTWKGYDMTDAGNAKRFLDAYEGILRYCPEKDVWFVWSGMHWEVDKRNVTRTQLSTILNTIEAQEEVTTDDLTKGVNFGLADDKERHRYIRTVKDFAQKSQSSRSLAGALDKAKADAGSRNLIVTLDDFDRNRWYVNTDNVLLNLNIQERTHNNAITVIPHHPRQLVSKLAGPKH